MAELKFTGISESYVFEEAGGMRDQLEQAILMEIQATRYPLNATISTLTASGRGLMGALGTSKEQCVVIQVDNDAKIAISNTTIGSYLYVEIFLVVTEKLNPVAKIVAMMDNAFKQQKRRAHFLVAKTITESACEKLNLKQVNTGYRSVPSKSF